MAKMNPYDRYLATRADVLERQKKYLEKKYGPEEANNAGFAIKNARSEDDFLFMLDAERNTAKENIKNAREQLKEADTLEEIQYQQRIIKKNENILKNPIRKLVQREEFSMSRDQARAVARMMKENYGDKVDYRDVQSGKITITDEMASDMRDLYHELKREGKTAKEASREVWHMYGGNSD